MGLKVDKARNNLVKLLIIIDFTPDGFNELVLEFRNEWEHYSNHFTLEGKPRQRMALPRVTNILPDVQDKWLFIFGVPKKFPFARTSGCDLFDEPATSQFGYISLVQFFEKCSNG